MNSKPTLVLMAGLPGAGKSTLARALKDKLDWFVINKDKYKEALLKEGWNDETAGIAAYNLAFEVARNVLEKQHASVILDSAALHTFILDEAWKIVHSIPNVQLKVILCVADRDLRNRRLRDRPHQITNIRVDPRGLLEYLALFQHLPPDPYTLELYTFLPLKQCLEKAEQFLKLPNRKLENADTHPGLVGAYRML